MTLNSSIPLAGRTHTVTRQGTRRARTVGAPQPTPQYNFEDIYSSYFSRTPTRGHMTTRDGFSASVDAHGAESSHATQRECSPTALRIPHFSGYRDSPIIRGNLSVSHSLPSSPETPPAERTYLWDPITFEWRVIDLLEWESNSGANESSTSGMSSRESGDAQPQPWPQLRRKCHIRRASEPPSSQLVIHPPSLPSSPQHFDSNESHPTLELAIRYSQPSPLTPAFDFLHTPTSDSPIAEVERWISIEMLGASGLTTIGVLRRNPRPYACILVAGQEACTPTPDKRTTAPVWNSKFYFESVKDTDSIVIRVCSDTGTPAKSTWHGSFMCTLRRMLLMQDMNDVLTLTLDRWPYEGQVLDSTPCGSITLRIRDLTSPFAREVSTPFTSIDNILGSDPPSRHDRHSSSRSSSLYGEIGDDLSHSLIPHIVVSEQDSGSSSSPTSPHFQEITHPKWFTDIVGRTLSLAKGRYPWVPSGNVSIIEGPVCGGRYCDVYVGEVYRARTVTRVALKQLRVFVNTSDNMKKMFCREVQFWSRLRHPNVLPFWGCLELDEYRLFMISPWAANGNSLQYVKKNPGVDRRRILQQTAEALAYLHSGEDGDALVHGDLKADNVLISENGDALLADFGLTRYVEKIATVSGTPSGISAHGHTRFSAPELLFPQPGKEARPTPKSDVFAFACLLIQLYTEELPFADIKVEAQVITEIIGGRIPTRPMGSALQRGLDDDIWTIASHCWRFVATARPSIRDVARRLR